MTVHSQQCRAINLVCALRERDPDLTEKRIAIIGAGAAGMTAATALRSLGVREDHLTLYEKAASPMYTQRWSYGRFLHPRLFHWPEAGWRDSQAHLPIADWRAGYAATVRERILAGCVALPIEFCTAVRDVEAKGEVARVTFRHLHSPWDTYAEFDLVLVATGFPPEPRVEGTVGGTYWHPLEGLDELQDDIHVVGDGDGALTEILMMLIDRFGHAAIEELCEWLPLTSVDKLHAKDLQAQGNPSEPANLAPEDVESPVIRTLFDLLSRGRRRTVTVHSTHPLSGASFLLNRALVTHLTWGQEPLVRLQSGASVEPQQAKSLGTTVIWRAGVAGVQGPEFAEARVSTKDLLNSLAPTGRIGPLEAGLLVGLLDGLRRPMWSPDADAELRAGIPGGSPGWTEPSVKGLSEVMARPSETAEELLRILAAAAAGLTSIGITDIDALEVDDARWVSIDLLACAGDCPHDALLNTAPRKIHIRASPTEPRANPRVDASSVRRDRWNRLWFRLPSRPSSVRPTRGAVRAMVPRSSLLEWARRESRSDGIASRKPAPARQLEPEVLSGLDDIAAGDRRANLQLATMHEARGEWEATKRAYLRAGRQPGGERLGSADPMRKKQTPDVNVEFRRVLLGLAGAAARVGDGEPDVVNHATWLMFSAAAANLVTLFGSKALLLDLDTTPAFLRGVWAPRVRTALRRSGADLAYARAAPPDWAQQLANLAFALASSEPRDGEQRELDTLRSIANEVAHYAEVEAPAEPLISLSEMGVWLAGTETDRELRESFNGAS